MLINDKTEEQVNRALDESIENLSPDVRRKLNQIRMQALQPKRALSPIWKWSGAVSFVLMITIAFQFKTIEQAETLTPFSAELEEDLEMLEDLEFIYWLAEENEIASL